MKEPFFENSRAILCILSEVVFAKVGAYGDDGNFPIYGAKGVPGLDSGLQAGNYPCAIRVRGGQVFQGHKYGLVRF